MYEHRGLHALCCDHDQDRDLAHTANNSGADLQRMPARTTDSAQPARARECLVIDGRNYIRPIAELEKDAIMQALILCEGDRIEAAKRLKISKSSIYRKLKAYHEAEKKQE